MHRNWGTAEVQHMMRSGTTAQHCGTLNQPAVNKCVGKSLKKPLQTGPGGLCPLCHVARLLWQGVPWLKIWGTHPRSSEYLPPCPVSWGLPSNSESRHRQHSWKRHAGRACRQIQLWDEVYLLSVTFIVFQGRRKKQGKVRQDESTEGSSAQAGFSEEVAFQRPQ